MPPELMRAVRSQDWQAAELILGTEFPPEWRQDGWSWLAPRISEAERDASLVAWSTRLARAIGPCGDVSGPVLAEIGFHGPPAEQGWVEVGYRVVAAFRRCGFAEEAVSRLLSWAAEQGVVGIAASVDPDNAASIGLLRKLGFVAGERFEHDVLGELIRFRRASTGLPARRA